MARGPRWGPLYHYGGSDLENLAILKLAETHQLVNGEKFTTFRCLKSLVFCESGEIFLAAISLISIVWYALATTWRYQTFPYVNKRAALQVSAVSPVLHQWSWWKHRLKNRQRQCKPKSFLDPQETESLEFLLMLHRLHCFWETPLWLRFLNEFAALVLLLVNSLYIRPFVLAQLFLYDCMKNADCYAHMPDLKGAISAVSTPSQSVTFQKAKKTKTFHWLLAELEQFCNKEISIFISHMEAVFCTLSRSFHLSDSGLQLSVFDLSLLSQLLRLWWGRVEMDYRVRVNEKEVNYRSLKTRFIKANCNLHQNVFSQTSLIITPSMMEMEFILRLSATTYFISNPGNRSRHGCYVSTIWSLSILECSSTVNFHLNS